MRPYEIVIIFDTEAVDTDINGVLDRVSEVIRNNGGKVGNTDRWGKKTFAYELRHKREGYYVLVEATVGPEAVKDLDRLLILADEVLRHKVIRLPDKAAGRRKPKANNATASATAG